MNDAAYWALWLVGFGAGIGVGLGAMYLWLTRDDDEDSVEEFACARAALAPPRVVR